MQKLYIWAVSKPLLLVGSSRPCGSVTGHACHLTVDSPACCRFLQSRQEEMRRIVKRLAPAESQRTKENSHAQNYCLQRHLTGWVSHRAGQRCLGHVPHDGQSLRRLPIMPNCCVQLTCFWWAVFPSNSVTSCGLARVKRDFCKGRSFTLKVGRWANQIRELAGPR